MSTVPIREHWGPHANLLAPGISSMLLKLLWETQQTVLKSLTEWMVHPGGAVTTYATELGCNYHLTHSACDDKNISKMQN